MNRNKFMKLFVITLLSGLLGILISATAFAEEITIDTGTCGGSNATFYYNNGILQLINSSNYDNTAIMTSWTYETYVPWYDYREAVREVVFVGKWGDIRNYAFKGMTNLKSVTFSENTAKIYQYAFAGCTSLETITLPGSLTSIGNYAFEGCTSLKNVIFPEGFSSLGTYSFKDCTALTTVTLPSTLTGFGTGPFIGCTALTDISFAEGNASFIKNEDGTVTDYAQTIIYYGGGVTGKIYDGNAAYSYYVPRSVTEIKSGAFPIPTEVEFYVHDGVTTIADDAFNSLIFTHCSHGTAMYELRAASLVNGYIYDGMCGDYLWYSVSLTNDIIWFYGQGEMYNFNTVDAPWSDAVGSITEIRSLAGATTIGEYAFHSAVSLNKIVWNKSITYIGRYAFGGCESLQTLKLPQPLEKIDTGAFFRCTQLSTITFPDTLKTIEQVAFYECSLLTAVSIPASVTYAELAFVTCENLMSYVVHKDNTVYASVDGVMYTKDLTELVAYPYGKDDEFLVIEPTVTKINRITDINKAVKNIVIPEGVTEITPLFAYGLKDTAKICGYTGTAAETFAAEGGFSFQALNGKDANESISWHFDPYSGTLTLSGTGALADNATFSTFDTWYERVKHVVIEEGITYIGSRDIWQYPIVETVTIPLSVSKIGLLGIYGNEKLTDIYYAGAIDDWNNIVISDKNDFNGATIHYGTVQSIRYVLASGGNIVVATTNIRDGKQVMVAAYDEDGRFISLHYVPIQSNMGELNGISTEGWAIVRAFMINLETLLPAANAVEGVAN